MPEQVISVGEFVDLLNQTLEFAYPVVVIEGEVASFKVSQGKWVHFDLKDSEATINCFMSVYQLKTPLEDGMKIRITASPKLTKWGRFSLTIRGIELAGEGTLQRAFALLKAQLEAEGLFAPNRKRPIPVIPNRIGVVSSQEAAGFADFIEIVNQRWRGVDIQLASVQVQGEPAPGQIVAAIEHFNQETPLPDVLVIIRGGGSREDLQAFNTEPVVRAIAASRVPTVVGVGHEVDITLADLAADMRAATPTDAARRIVPDQVEVLQRLDYHRRQLDGYLQRQLQTHQLNIQRSANRLEQFWQVPKLRVVDASRELHQAMAALSERSTNRLEGILRILKNVDPQLLLKRGYAIARRGNTIIRSATQLAIGDRLELQLAEDSLQTEVKNIRSTKKE